MIQLKSVDDWLIVLAIGRPCPVCHVLPPEFCDEERGEIHSERCADNDLAAPTR